MKTSNHVTAGLKIVFVIALVSVALSAIAFALPVILAFATMVLPVVGIAICIVAVVWLLGFLFNTGKSGVARINRLK